MTAPDAAAPDPARIPARRHRRGGSPLDMLRSLGLVGVIVVVVVLFNSSNQPARPPVTTDIAATVAAARAEAAFPVLAATTLPAGVYANTARIDAEADGHWTFHIGYTDGATEYLLVDASDATGDAALTNPYPDATPIARRTLSDMPFTVYADSKAEVWFHAATAKRPFAVQISCSNRAFCAAVGAELSDHGSVATGSATAS